jgi:hypothetical protein
MTRWMAAGLTAGALLGSAAGSRGAEARPLPPFSVTTLDAATAERAAVIKPGRWLLVYVRPQSAPSRALLGALEKARSAAAGSVAIVVAGDVAAAKAMADGFPGLKTASWYADLHDRAFKDLRLAGAPVVLGLQDDAVRWSLAGVVPDRETLPSVLGSW